MKRLFALLMLLAAHAQAVDASFGGHGMALFGGKEALYLSHLPMFHAPHDYQVVLQVHLADATQDAMLRARLDGKTALWTVDPVPFELSRLGPTTSNPLRQFKADIVLGHFEQGGKQQYAGQLVVVDKVLVYRQLAPQPHVSARAHYLPVGRFLVKEIDSRPDFDHIVAMATASTQPVDVAKAALAEPAAAALAKAANVKVLGTIYYFTDDLK